MDSNITEGKKVVVSYIKTSKEVISKTKFFSGHFQPGNFEKTFECEKMVKKGQKFYENVRLEQKKHF